MRTVDLKDTQNETEKENRSVFKNAKEKSAFVSLERNKVEGRRERVVK